MIPFTPRHGARLGQARLGQDWSGITGGLTSGVAKDIVREAEPPVRRIIQEERYRFSTAIINGLPFFGVGALAYIATRYFVPDDKKTAKGVGYLTAAAAGTIGGWYVVSKLKEGQIEEPPPQPETATSGTVTALAQNAAKAIVAEAEPKIRRIVDEERARIAEAGQAALPFAVGSVATFLATLLLVGKENNLMKALGYTGSVLLMGTGLWLGLEKEKEAA